MPLSPDIESFNCPKTSLLEGFVTPIFHVVYLKSGLQTRSMPKAHAALIPYGIYQTHVISTGPEAFNSPVISHFIISLFL